MFSSLVCVAALAGCGAAGDSGADDAQAGCNVMLGDDPSFVVHPTNASGLCNTDGYESAYGYRAFFAEGVARGKLLAR